MTRRPPTMRFSVPNHPAECGRVYGVVDDGTIRCRALAAVTVEYLAFGRVSHFCGECFPALWDAPSLEEIEAVRELEI